MRLLDVLDRRWEVSVDARSANILELKLQNSLFPLKGIDFPKSNLRLARWACVKKFVIMVLFFLGFTKPQTEGRRVKDTLVFL